MSRLDFVAHNQLHEVVLGYLKGDEILNYRAVHSACDDVVLGFAKVQLQDVIGQEMPSTALDGGPTDTSGDGTLRSMDAVLVPLLVCCGEDVAEIITTAMAPPRSISDRLFHSDSDALKSKAVAAVCQSMAGADRSSFNTFKHVDVSWAFGKPPESTSWPPPRPSITAAAITSFLSKCRHLQSLDISNIFGLIGDAGIEWVLKECTQLTSLNVRKTTGREEGAIKCLAVGRQRLLNVSAIGDDTSDASMALMNCRNLTQLDISWTEDSIKGVPLEVVAAQAPQLQFLNVSGSRITDKSIVAVATNCLQLKSLDISYSGSTFATESMKLLATNCIHLESLKLAGTCVHDADQFVTLLGINCVHLQVLDVSSKGGMVITDESLSVVAMNCRKLKSLDISRCGRVTDASIMLLANCPQLRVLRLKRLRYATDESIDLIARNCLQLRELSVASTLMITDQSIVAVALHCRYLESLDVSETKGRITDASIKLVASNCLRLRFLNISGIKITAAVCATLPSTCKVKGMPYLRL